MNDKWTSGDAMNAAYARATRGARPEMKTGRTLTVHAPGETLPQCWGGTNWGAPQFILARHGCRVVLYRPGNKYWSGIGSSSYAPCEVYGLDLRASRGYPYDREHFRKGGRLSSKLISELTEKINAYLRCDNGFSAAGRIDPKKRWTVEVNPTT